MLYCLPGMDLCVHTNEKLGQLFEFQLDQDTFSVRKKVTPLDYDLPPFLLNQSRLYCLVIIIGCIIIHFTVWLQDVL